jgi:four helix bundle protein
MATFQSFEEIEAWQEARKLTRRIYTVSSQGDFRRDFGLRDQIRRASVSILSNIAEGHERGGTPEFIRFLSIAKGSAGEVRAQLYVAIDQNYLGEEPFKEMVILTTRISRMISGLISYLRSAALRRTRHKISATKNRT